MADIHQRPDSASQLMLKSGMRRKGPRRRFQLLENWFCPVCHTAPIPARSWKDRWSADKAMLSHLPQDLALNPINSRETLPHREYQSEDSVENLIINGNRSAHYKSSRPGEQVCLFAAVAEIRSVCDETRMVNLDRSLAKLLSLDHTLHSD